MRTRKLLHFAHERIHLSITIITFLLLACIVSICVTKLQLLPHCVRLEGFTLNSCLHSTRTYKQYLL
jgi:cytochrome c oxidase assembly factor CtaG